MRTHFQRSIGLGLFALTLAVAVQAQGKSEGKGHGKDKGEGKHVVDARHVNPGVATNVNVPGQYKKRYGTNQGASVLGDILRQRGYTVTRIVPAGYNQNVYYRSSAGVEQLAIVSPGKSRLSFQNVPAALLQEVLARLY